VFLADQDGEQRIVAEAVVVVEIAIAEAESEDSLLEKFGEGVLDEFGVAVIGETVGELVEEVELGFDLPQEESTGVGGHRAAVKTGDHVPGSQGLEGQFWSVTVCHGATVSGVDSKGLWLFPLCQLRVRRASPLVRNRG